jgi:hypothetical protein
MENNISDTLDTLMMLILYPSIEINNTPENNEQSSLTEDNNTQSLTDDDTTYNELLNSSLYDKFTYKYILSEEGESQLKTINFIKDTTDTKKLEAINNICPITSLEFEENQNITSLPCNHYFDTEAINKWLREEKAECPVCRFKLHSKEVKIDEKNYIREHVNSLIDLYRSRINLINSLTRVNYEYNPFSDNYFNMLVREREIYEEYNDLIQNMTYTIFRRI